MREEISERDVFCLVDSGFGRYIPQVLCERYRDQLVAQGFEDDIAAIDAAFEDDKALDGEAQEHAIWAYENILDYAQLEFDGEKYWLFQSDDLFAVRVGYELPGWFM